MCHECMNRRQFAALTAAGIAGGIAALSSATGAETQVAEPWDPDRAPVVTGVPLKVQPVFMHAVYQPRERTSWRSWSRIINEAAAAEESQRIEGELNALAARRTSRFSSRPWSRSPPAKPQHGSIRPTTTCCCSTRRPAAGTS